MTPLEPGLAREVMDLYGLVHHGRIRQQALVLLPGKKVGADGEEGVHRENRDGPTRHRSDPGAFFRIESGPKGDRVPEFFHLY